MKIKILEPFEIAFFHDGKSYEKGILEDVDPEELKMGIEIEKEHSNNMEIRIKIASDHLAENKYYYTWLTFMEKLMKKYKTLEDYKKENE